MNLNKHFKAVCIACTLVAALSGCGSFPSAKPSQNTPAAAGTPVPDTQAGTADAENSYITIDRLKSIVLENSGFTEENVRFVRLKLVSENGIGKYDVEFVSDTVEYDYMVDAATGEILSMNCEMGNYDIANIPSDIAQTDPSQAESSQGAGSQTGNTQAEAQQAAGSQTGNTQAEAQQAAGSQTGNTQAEAQQAAGSQTGNTQAEAQQAAGSQTGNSQNGSTQTSAGQNGADNQYIGREAAQQAALAHANLDADAVRFAHTHLEFDDGRWKYDVEFHKGHEEYDYDIDALTGEILSYDYDAEYINSGAAASQGGEYITREKATQIALAHAGVSESDAQYLKVDFDYDDGIAEYEVEWYVGRMEYSCDVNAYTGEILSFDKELD